MIYFISDLHFNSNNIIKMDDRKFKDFTQMNEFMIKQWNSKVKDNDTVIILGDFARGEIKDIENILKQLKGQKILIKGNHDEFVLNPNFNKKLFLKIEDYYKVRIGDRNVICSHYPIVTYEMQHRKNKDGKQNTYMFHGHIHNTQDQALVDEFVEKSKSILRKNKFHEDCKFNCFLCNCFCVYSNYIPLTMQEWINLHKKRLKIE